MLDRFLKVVIVIILLNINMAGGNFVLEGFECKNCVSLDTGIF